MVDNLFQYKFDFEYDALAGNANFFNVYNAVINDFPELFFVDCNFIEWCDLGKLKVAGKILYTKEEIEKIHSQLEEILHKFDHIKEPFELQEAVTEFICKEYTYSTQCRGEKQAQEKHTVVGLLKRKRGVCSAFAKLGQFIFQRRGIPVAYVIADSREAENTENNSHGWLAIKHGGSYYHWDITSIHSAYHDPTVSKNVLFNVTDKEVAEDYIYPTKEYKKLKCDKIDYNYYEYKGLYFKSYDELYAGCMKFIKEMDYTKGDITFDFRVTPEIDTDEICDHVPNDKEITKILKGTGYGCSRHNTILYDDKNGYYSYKISIKKHEIRKLSAVQPKYYHESEPSKNIREYLKEKLEYLNENEIMVLPEYSNAGGTNDPEIEKAEMKYAAEMKKACAKKAKERKAYVAVNVLEERKGCIRNSTYLYNREGKVSFVYDKVHLPPSEIELGVKAGDGKCTCVVDNVRFAFMTCYDIYFNEQIEHIAKFKPDIIILCGYQRGEKKDIINAQATLLAYRCNSFVIRSSYSMDKENFGGNSMIVSPIGKIEKILENDEGIISHTENVKLICYRQNGFGGNYVPNDEFINNGLRPDIFNEMNKK